MMADRDRAEVIRDRAYLLWERGGRPCGREHEFWAQARQEMEDEQGPAPEEANENRFVAR